MNSYFAISNILRWAGGIFGILTVFFWSITYILIVIAGFYSKKERKVSMPYVSGVLNIGWEVAAIIFTEGNPGFIVWFVIDLFIFFWGVSFLQTAKRKLLYCISIILTTTLILLSFRLAAPAFLFTVYLIDVIMGMEYLIKRTKLAKRFKASIAVTRLLGDLFAGLTFYATYDFVVIFAIVCFVCNCTYLIKCIREKN